MEVHHPHHPSHKKKWSEYFLEFLMLFLAVTLGFFAENIREHQVLVERKNQNLEAILEDLKRDSIQLNARNKEYHTALKDFEDLKYASLNFQRKVLPEKEYIDYIIRKSDSLSVGTGFHINNSAYKNTISTGSLSVINSPNTKRLIAEYYEELGIKLQENNSALDLESNEFIQKTILFGIGYDSEARKKVAKISHVDFHNDLKNVPAFVKSITDPSFRVYTNKFEARCDYYLFVINRFQKVNKKLIEELIKKEY